ncbi:Uncharacterized protein dnm_065160 [Desulfonema magnum]|uniref:Uncharacterized protein n=1 Tax=Desulfonema magnum TaxID=45655 RepID=A0A975BRW7_9BACT|nr:Uncharacterized protein dnm_065160 [Desulfonema magnum]
MCDDSELKKHSWLFNIQAVSHRLNAKQPIENALVCSHS